MNLVECPEFFRGLRYFMKSFATASFSLIKNSNCELGGVIFVWERWGFMLEGTLALR